MSKTKQRVVRVISILWMLFALAFSVSYKKTGFCLGDNILAALGIPAWSRGTQGTHYTVLIGFAMMLAAFGLFSATTKERKTVFRVLSYGFFGVLILLAMFFSC